MKLGAQIAFFGLLVALIEVGVYAWSIDISDMDSVKYSLASRYSARVTLILFEGMLLWGALIGLKKIYSSKKSREIMILLVSLVTINHLIHFVFLTVNHWVNDYQLFTFRSAGGAVGYLIMIIAPFYLAKHTGMTKQLYWKVLGAFLFIDIIALVSYMGRWNKELPMASSKEVYIGIMASIVVILLMNVYRIFAERKLEYSS